MNFIDILILLVFIYAGFKGVLRGFVIQLFSLLGVIIGIYLAKAYAENFSALLTDWISFSKAYTKPLAFFIIFFIVILGCHFLAKLLAKSIKISLTKLTNRLLGALLAIFKYALVLSIFLNVYQNLDKKEKIISKTRKQSSALYYPVTNLVPKIMPYVDRNFMK